MRAVVPLALVTGLLLAAAPALAQERHWTFIGGCGSADWFGTRGGPNAQGKTTCWSSTADGASGQPLPTVDDTVYILHAHPTLDLGNVFSVPTGVARTGRAHALTIAGLAGRYASLSVSADRLEVFRSLHVGSAGLGRFDQSGGEVLPSSLWLGSGSADSVGRYALSGGTLSVMDTVYVGFEGRGEFVQTGGGFESAEMSITRPGALPGAPPGSPALSVAELSGGRADVGTVWVGDERGVGAGNGGGRLRVSGTAELTATRVRVSPWGQLQLDGGVLALNKLDLDPTRFAFTGGELRFRGAAEVRSLTATPASLSLGTLEVGANPTLRLLANATLTLPTLHVGPVGWGTLAVETGAVLRTTEATLGVGQAIFLGEGRAQVAGAGARWENGGALRLGALGTARLALLDGGRLDSAHAVIGATGQPGSVPGRNAVRIEGAGSAWTNAGALWVGGGEDAAGVGADLLLLDGGQLSVGGTLHLHAGSTLTAIGGRWSAARTVSEGRIDVVGSGGPMAGALELRAGSVFSTDAPLTLDGPVTLQAGARLDAFNVLRFNGAATLAPGALLGGDAAKVFAGGLSLGDTRGTLVDGGALTVFAAGNVFSAALGGAAPDRFDRYVSLGTLQLGGTLRLLPWEGYQGLPGHWFDLFDGQLAGQFAAVDTSAFALAPGLQWDLSRLNTEGLVGFQIQPVPEPPAALLLLLGGALLAGARRRFMPA